jgi:Rhs element Vgr protein
MAQSPTLDQNHDLISYDILIDGAAIPVDLSFAKISVSKSLNKIATARIEIDDGKPFDGKFTTMEEKTYVAGKTIEIQLGYHSTNDVIFKGIIVKHGVKISTLSTSKIIIDCADKSIALTGQREFEIFKESKDSEIIQDLADKKGISVQCSATQVKHERVVQQNCSGWDFIITRAQANYLVAFTDNGTLKLVKPGDGAKKDLKATFGTDVTSMDLSIDGRSQMLEVETSSWDFKAQANVQGRSKEPTEIEKLSDQKGKDVAGNLNYTKTFLHSTAKMDQPELNEWAESTLLISRLSKVRGTVTTKGFAKINPNDFLEIKSIGKHFDGEAYVSGVHHTVKEGSWKTEIEIGIKPELFVSSKPEVVLPPADGLFPGYQGLFIGKVLKVHGDPDGEDRVLVQIPLLGKELASEGVWARVSNIMASHQGSKPKEYGSFFFPDEDDEVILGALGGDMRFPIILGHLYSSGRKFNGEFTLDEANNNKGWITKSGLLFHFDDDKKRIRLETPGGQKITLTDDGDADAGAKSITLEDEHNNKMVMDSKGFKFTGQRDFVVDVGGKIENKAGSDIKLQASMGVDAQAGMNISLKGNGVATLEGSGSAKVTSTGMTAVKGSVVMIN